MAIGKVNNVTWDNLAKVDGVTKANIAKISNVGIPVSFANAYAVAKSITTGASNYIRATTPADSPVNFTQTDAFTISFWIKVGWNSSLNTSVFPFCIGPTDATTHWDNQIRLRYREDNNRLVFRMLNNPGAGNYDIEAQWYFHTGGFGDAGKSGLGTTYWSASNRGNVGENDFTLITIVKTTSTAGSAVRIYWNANDLGAPPITGDSSPSSLGMVSNEARELVIGSNTQPWHSNDYYRAGNSTETQYNDFAIWDVALDADAITAIFNSGVPIDLTSDSGDYDNSANLQVYYPFENNGDNEGVETNVSAATVAGDSNFESL